MNAQGPARRLLGRLFIGGTAAAAVAVLVILALGLASAVSSERPQPDEGLPPELEVVDVAVRSEAEGNPFAAMGLDCDGGEAGSLTIDGLTDGFTSAEEAATSHLIDMVDVAAEAKSAPLILVDVDPKAFGAVTESREYAVQLAGRVVAHVAVYQIGKAWYIGGSWNCVAAGPS